MVRRGNQSGRIRPHDRNVDDPSNIIACDDTIDAEHASAIVVTEQSHMENKTRNEYRNRIKRIIQFWFTHYPSYYENGTRLLSEAEKADPVKYHHRNNRDLVYSGLDVKFVKAYLSYKKKKKIDKRW